eukprot:CAMPEP_0176207594 /NCGR_PEP_ID=MMETSP0121_2-20121125/12695_1 /TAXON_ID=160619 /ORGANISM="Kryptoperidinium foliaceum, Strain CCMP 1326" /LENGTH=89 /DNA_ID=CAMNT_0017546573 /DNA_START=82 /DNA_END=351 /DNA_ORIENTATION=+
MALRLLRALALAIGLFLAAGEAETECMGFGCPEEDEGYDDMSILQSFGSGQGSRHLPGQQKVVQRQPRLVGEDTAPRAAGARSVGTGLV